MKRKELLKLVWMNLIQNKFKVVLTSVGIIIGAATIVMVIAIGQGGKKEVAEQFKNLNAGAIDISYELANGQQNSEKSGRGNFPGGFSGGGAPNGGTSGKSSNNMGQMPGFMQKGSNGDLSSRTNQEMITLSEEDVEDLEVFVPEISSVSISYTTRSVADGGDLEEETSYTVAGVKPIYAKISNLGLQVGEFLTDEQEKEKTKVCVLGASAAKEIFGSASEAYDSTLYIGGRPYIVNGVLEEVGTVSSGISPDETIFLPYSTGKKYITGDNISPTITVIAENLDHVDQVIENIQMVLAESYPNAEFTISDAGSKMEAASKSNETLTTLLFAMAFIVFLVGGIGIMNVLFVSVKERTKEIGILKAIGCSKRDILSEFLLEACFISILGGILGIGLSFFITPVAVMLQIPVSLSVTGMMLALCFAVVTGTVFGFYPAWKASCLVPVEALSEE